VLVRTGGLAKPGVIGYRNDKIAPIGEEFSHQAGKDHLITDQCTKEPKSVFALMYCRPGT